MPSRNVAIALLKLIDVLADLGLDRLRRLHAMERQLEVLFAFVAFHCTFPDSACSRLRLRRRGELALCRSCTGRPFQPAARRQAMRKINASVKRHRCRMMVLPAGSGALPTLPTLP